MWSSPPPLFFYRSYSDLWVFVRPNLGKHFLRWPSWSGTSPLWYLLFGHFPFKLKFFKRALSVTQWVDSCLVQRSRLLFICAHLFNNYCCFVGSFELSYAPFLTKLKNFHIFLLYVLLFHTIIWPKSWMISSNDATIQMLCCFETPFVKPTSSTSFFSLRFSGRWKNVIMFSVRV